MLVLKRKVEECITIADKIKIKVLSITGESVNLGVDAPREVQVLRTENLNENGNGNGNGISIINGNGKKNGKRNSYNGSKGSGGNGKKTIR